MRVPINLASQPFRRDRPMLIATAACAVALLGLLGVLIFLIVGERASASDSRIAVQKLNNQLRGINAEQAKLDYQRAKQNYDAHAGADARDRFLEASASIAAVWPCDDA